MNRDAEIGQINHELEILRSRYAIYERWGRVLRVFFIICMPLAGALFLFGLVKLFLSDPVTGFFFVGLAIVISGLIWLAAPSKPIFRRPSRPGKFWIDMASPSVRPMEAVGPSFYIGFWQRRDSEIIEEQITEREQRLKELEAAS